MDIQRPSFAVPGTGFANQLHKALHCQYKALCSGFLMIRIRSLRCAECVEKEDRLLAIW